MANPTQPTSKVLLGIFTSIILQDAPAVSNRAGLRINVTTPVQVAVNKWLTDVLKLTTPVPTAVRVASITVTTR